MSNFYTFAIIEAILWIHVRIWIRWIRNQLAYLIRINVLTFSKRVK
jgi:hypothetical protein